MLVSRQRVGILAATASAALLVSVLQAQTTSVERVSTFSRPVYAVSPPGDADRLFVAEQHTGRIEIVDLATDTVIPTPFLDLGGLATLSLASEILPVKTPTLMRSSVVRTPSA